MESFRSMLFIALMVVTFLLFQQWQVQNAPVAPVATTNQSSVPASTDSQDFVPESSQVSSALPEIKQNSAKLITVTTDVLSVKINTQGGDIVDVKLLKFDTELNSGVPITIMQNGTAKYIAQSGLTGANGIDRTVKGRPIYQTSAKNFTLTGDQPLIVSMVYLDANGISATKQYTFSKNSYEVALDYIVTNNTNSAANVQLYAQLKQSSHVDTSSGLVPTYRGAAFSTSEDKYQKYDFDDIADVNLNISTPGGWVAMLQHYFVSAWVPKATDINQLYTSYTQNGDAVIGFKAPAINIEPHSEAITSAVFYVGPKDQGTLENIADGLDLTVDYGFLFMISQPLFWLLLQIHTIVGNWGLAIIVITLIVKGGMYPLTKAQYTSMARMRELQPKMTALKERFGDDRQKMSQAMMELYRKEKVNPAGGCLPILIQMPIFLALYWVFLESYELRQAPFFLWIQDLSSKDPYYVLPVLMGISMFVMQRMTPITAQDPMQQKMMQYMPVIFTVFFFWFPSGLVLYWFISNMISIVQMKIIFNGIEKKKLKTA